MRFARLVLLLTRLPLRPWSERAAVLYAVVGMLAGIIFGPTAMRPHDLTGLALGHPWFGAALCVIWIVAATPSARALLVVPAGFVLRSLPVPRWQLALVPMAHVVLAELPWALLWIVGEGPVLGLAMTLGAAATHALVVARSPRLVDGAPALLLIVMVAAPLPAVGRLLVALLAVVLAGAVVWRRAPEVGSSQGYAWVRGTPSVATALALLVAVVRAEPAVLVRGAGLCLLGAACALLGQRNNHVTAPSSVVAVLLAVGAPPLGAALAAVGGAVLRAERRTSWLLSACGATPLLRVLAAGAAAGVVGLVGGTAHAAAIAVGSGLPVREAPRLLCAGGLLGMALGAAGSSLARIAGDGPRASDRLLGGALALVLFASIATGLRGELGLGLVVAASLLLGWVARSRVA